MKPKEATVLLVEDDAPQRKTLAGFLRKRGYTLLEAGSATEAETVAKSAQVDLLLTDLRLGGLDGISLLESLRQTQADLQCLVVTAYGTVDDAVRAMRAGAYDFLAKPVDLDRLESLVEKALERVKLARENRELREVVKSSGAFSSLVGESEPMSQVKELAIKVAPSKASVLILGESGTGKEILARSIHLASPRREKPFVAVNCAALPETLIEAELFGHEKGAFTGATSTKIGRFELAHGGTLFLDEVGDIPLPVQVKLLSVLQNRSFERVGGTDSHKVDVRVLAATHRDLEARIQEETFREDLYYRLNVVAITLPPLRERADDIPLLINFLLHKHADLASCKVESIDAAVLKHLMKWPFRGNVRELENIIERAVVLTDGPTLIADDFPSLLFANSALSHSIESAANDEPGDGEGLEQGLEAQVIRLETSLIKAALERHQQNKSAAARALNMSERGMRYKMKKYGL